MAFFKIEDLTFSYPSPEGYREKPSLEGVDLEIRQGEYITLCGRSGSGKTTLLRHFKSVLTPHGKRTGRILYRDKDIKDTDLRTQSADIGFVMQNPDSQIVTDKVWHELAFGLESLGVDQQSMRLRVAEMASYFGIQDWFYKDTALLSGGQKQILNLASIMAMEPKILVLDEPTSQLDPIAASDFLQMIKKINLELGTTIVITEHRLEDVLHASDRVLVMEDGRLIADDRPEVIGSRLREKNSDIFESMPAPVKIYYGVTGGDEEGDCPLTVRDGRSWLSGIFEGREDEKMDISLAGDEKNARMRDVMADVTKNSSAVTLKDVWFRYGKDLPDVLKGVSLDVPENSIYSIVGGNGTGKSTMLKSLCNICRPYRGKIYIKGKKIKEYSAEELFRNNICLLPQDPQSIFVKKTVKEDLMEMAPEEDGEEKAAEIASICEITDLLDNHPYDLSGGEQQRAALAKVLLTEPSILLMDEPTKGIDSFFKKKFAEIMEKLRKRGTTIIMVSHDVEFCARYSDYVSLFFDGSVITSNTPDRFFAQNNFYTTAANRMSRHIFSNGVTVEDVIDLCMKNR